VVEVAAADFVAAAVAAVEIAAAATVVAVEIAEIAVAGTKIFL
jgi:hypothetical protein